eukprot:CAMPEP_0113309238 /NCGR_PEP_ID=MMETSP0010_2-20120614/7366_1 /TAXON_ID=216773 ORGANISM="Corethron hystrix, Strain 308" /NCGR_SAMPLE_ID=MMETSP0010_2 /ASSEMBLY_ACC=CAM_ASM_000155 /LENGTH=311 /DNA_ID=CAMNT_0000164459 /DNA_START=86 /DNA_END=1021 /DNA_ORIENTATION=+ /assembly_acc=CAM_ASM_000155
MAPTSSQPECPISIPPSSPPPYSSPVRLSSSSFKKRRHTTSPPPFRENPTPPSSKRHKNRSENVGEGIRGIGLSKGRSDDLRGIDGRERGRGRGGRSGGREQRRPPIPVLIDGRPPTYLPRPSSPSFTPEIARRIAQRQKAIDFGKNTAGYENYCRAVPPEERRQRGGIVEGRPNTPDVYLDIGTRRWQGMVKAWRRQLHAYDPPGLAKEHAARIAKAAEEGNNALVDPLSRILDGVRTGGATDEEMSNVRRIVDGGLVEVQTVKEQINEDGDECMGFDVGRSEHYDGGVGKNDRIEWGAMSDSEEEDDLL